MSTREDLLRKRLRRAHVVWALLAGSICVLLAAGGGGHPPPIVFVPVVAAVWVMVHLALWAAGWLASRGLARAPAATGEKQSWPLALIAILAATAAAVFAGLVQLAVSLLLGRYWPFAGTLWIVMLAVWTAHAVCLAGVLLRRRWARWVAALLCIGWALALAWEVLEPAVRGYVQPLQIGLALAVVIGLALAAHHLVRSERIRAFLAS